MKEILTAYAQSVDLGTNYGYGYINNLGEGFSHLVIPGFAIAGTGVSIYFLIGAFKVLTSGGEKEALSSARNMITHAIIGFILLMVMFLVLKFLPGFFGLGDYKIIG